MQLSSTTMNCAHGCVDYIRRVNSMRLSRGDTNGQWPRAGGWRGVIRVIRRGSQQNVSGTRVWQQQHRPATRDHTTSHPGVFSPSILTLLSSFGPISLLVTVITHCRGSRVLSLSNPRPAWLSIASHHFRADNQRKLVKRRAVSCVNHAFMML